MSQGTDGSAFAFDVEQYEKKRSEEKTSDVVSEVIDGRVSVYGNPVETFVRIADMWSAILDHRVKPHEVPLMMQAMKIIRATQAPDYSDNIDDIEGYSDIYRKLIGTDMIEARSVTDYLEQRAARGIW